MVNKLNKVVRKSATKQKPVPVKIVYDSSRSTGMVAGEDMKYKAQDALRTLQRAKEIERNRPLMKAVKAEAKSMMKNLSNVCK